jgi:sucrose phosphorylase
VTLDRLRALELVTALYGSEAPVVLEQLEGVLRNHRAALATGQASPSLDPSDAFLIAYPDQVRTPGRPPLQVLSDFCDRHLRDTTRGLHVLPFFPSSSDDGFSVTDPRAVDPALGDWRHIEDLGRRFHLMVDLVLNHASAQGSWFELFRRRTPPFDAFFREPEPDGDWSRVVRPRTSPLFTDFETAAGRRRTWTTFGPDQVDLDYRRPAVLLEMVDLLLSYIEHGAQVLRLDAVAYVWKESGTPCVHLAQTHALVRILRLATRAAAPWVRLITETNVPHEEGLAYLGEGDEADWVYAFALPPLVVHALTAADAVPLTKWAGSLRPLPEGTALFTFLASHDGIGLNGAAGFIDPAQLDRLVRLGERCGAVSYRSDLQGASSPYELNANLLDLLAGVPAEEALPSWAVPRMICAHAILLALAGIPAIYFHSLFGSRGDAAAVLRTGAPRAINRERLDRGVLERELGQSGSLRRSTFDALSRLIRARRSLPALHPQAPQRALDLGPQVFGLERTTLNGSGRLICLHEIGGRHTVVRPPAQTGAGRDLLSGEEVPLNAVPLAPYQPRWIEVVR